MIGFGLEVEAFGEAMCGCSSLGSKVRVDLIGRYCDSEILVVLLMVDLRVMDISGVDVILDMDLVYGPWSCH